MLNEIRGVLQRHTGAVSEDHLQLAATKLTTAVDELIGVIDILKGHGTAVAQADVEKAAKENGKEKPAPTGPLRTGADLYRAVHSLGLRRASAIIGAVNLYARLIGKIYNKDQVYRAICTDIAVWKGIEENTDHLMRFNKPVSYATLLLYAFVNPVNAEKLKDLQARRIVEKMAEEYGPRPGKRASSLLYQDICTTFQTDAERRFPSLPRPIKPAS